ncbi:MAG: S8 family peptidase [Ginsengibacter sp.]
MHNLLKRLFIFSLFLPSFTFSQLKETPKNWHQLDRATSGYYGISLDKAYQLLKFKKSRQIVVALIDSGIDTTHEDLKQILWANPGEKPGNGIDDDHNGYIDDVHGWNFLGGKDGKNVTQDSDEGARTYHRLKAKFGENVPSEAGHTPAEIAEIKLYKKVKAKIESDETQAIDLVFMRRIYQSLLQSDSLLKLAMNKKVFTGLELEKFIPSDAITTKAKDGLFSMMKGNNTLEQTNKDFMEGFGQFLTMEERKKEQKTKTPENYRAKIVKDDENNISDKYYGNNDIMSTTSFHGSHCAGIIAAARNNGIGVDGIADNVKIMMIRAVPDGDEHDKDIALAIRYAVDNGANIISMSFGKQFSPQKAWVDDAVKYAASKSVLLVQAAGNDAKNVDSAENFPNPIYADGSGRNNTYITVGASGDPSNGGIVANFSNYGKKNVDVFAPGVNIYSTIPGEEKYGFASGTSMAGPVVAGVAALIMEYYPKLSIQQVKAVIEKSAVPLTEKVNLPGSDDGTGHPVKVFLSDISRSGGIINAYEAIKLAANISGENNLVPKVPLLKTKLHKSKLN